MLIKKELETLTAAPTGMKNSGIITYHSLKRSGKIMQIAAYDSQSQLAAQIFLDGKNCCSRSGSGIWDDSIYRNMANSNIYYSSFNERYSVKEEAVEKAKTFLKVSNIWNNTAADIVMASEREKRWKASVKKQEQTDERMEKYQKYMSLAYITKREHEKLSRFCRDTVFDYNFGIIDHKKTQTCICGKCRKAFRPEKKTAVGMSGKCPRCGIKLYYITEKSRLSNYPSNKTFMYCKKERNGDLIVAKIAAEIAINKEKTQYPMGAEAVHIYPADKKESYLYYYSSGFFYSYPGWKERKNEYIYGKYHTGYYGIYTVPVFPNLDRVFDGKWHNVDIVKTMKEHNIPDYKLDDLLQKTYAGYTEMLVKNGFFSFLQADYDKLKSELPIRKNRHSFADTFRMLPEERKVYVQCQVTPDEHFEVLSQYPNEFHSAAEIEKMRRLAYKGSKELVKRGYKLEKILNYINKQTKRTGNSPDMCRILWEDYLNICSQCAVDLLTDKAEFPDDIIKAHDRVVAIKAEMDRIKLEEIAKKRAAAQEKAYTDAVNACEDGKLGDTGLGKQFMEKFEKVTKKLKKVGTFSNGIYSMLIPQTITDFALEGMSLSNCVFSSGYYKKHANSESYIFFLRRSTNEKRPFFCMEITPNGELIQLRGYSNCLAPDDVKAFAEDFLTHYRNRMRIVSAKAS